MSSKKKLTKLIEFIFINLYLKICFTILYYFFSEIFIKTLHGAFLET
jgi:hypothetical protein